MDDFENRWSYAVCFGAITSTIVLLFLRGSTLSENNYNTAINGEKSRENQFEMKKKLLKQKHDFWDLQIEFENETTQKSACERLCLLRFFCVSVSLGLAFSFEVCIAFWPFFGCLITHHKFIGALIGLCYGSFWYVSHINCVKISV